ncbi:unnamed protein product [Schistosoma turkestanicum]|nr:unnamed protein product [Schistosoma turkestanicum]
MIHYSLKWLTIISIIINDYLTINFIQCQVKKSRPMKRIYFIIDDCEHTLQLGNWCKWSRWSKCELATCTRLRYRECNCPKPKEWTKATECKTFKPQNDYRVNDTIIKHTRHIRLTSTTQIECQIPLIHEGVYYPDCFKYQPKSKTMKSSSTKLKSNLYCKLKNDTEFELCAKNVMTLEILTNGIREYDVGACANWYKILGWSMENLSTKSKLIYDSSSELGRQCSFETNEYYPFCTYYTFYSEHTRSDFGRLNNLAYNIDNCRFACAIHQECKAIEFLYGIHCILAFKFDKSTLSQLTGTIIEVKPNQCHPKVKDKDYIYPYGTAVSILHDKFKK